MAEAARERTGLEAARNVAPVAPWLKTDGPVRRRTSAQSSPPAAGWRVADALLGVTILLGVFIAGNVDRMPQGVEEFLAVRLSLKNVLLLTGFGLAWPALLWACGLYDPKRLSEGEGEWPRIFAASAIAGVVALAFPLTSQSGAARPVHALIFAVVVAPSVGLLRVVVRAGKWATRLGEKRRTLVVGSGAIATWVYRGFAADRGVRREVVGFVDSDPQPSLPAAGVRYLGSVEQLERLLMHEIVDEVFIALPVKSRYEDIQQTIVACERVGVPAIYPTPLFKTTLGRPRIEQHADTPVMALAVAADDYRLIVKRVIDIVGAAIAIVLLLPMMLLIAAAIKLASPGPVLFTQERYGYMKRRFRMLKFRTMVESAESLQTELEIQNEATGPVFKIRDDPRITPFGRFLRHSSLDELPQLWHVLTGEMSLVGPRPLAVRDVRRFSESWLMRRFSVRPGLTCLWQISGRSDLGFDQWIAMDLEYIDGWSLLLDVQILLRTIPAVVSGRGAT